MTLPLENIKVMDLSRYLPGSYCTMTLGDMGADVLKIEQPGGPPDIDLFPVNRVHTAEESAAYDSLGRNKRSIALNLKSSEAKEIFYKLAEKTDVILESYRPGVTTRLGIDYDTIRKLNPEVIYCSITGYGQDGPYRNLPGHDINFIALSGVLGVLNEGGFPPVVPGIKIADIGGGGLQATVGILLALLARDRTGNGQYIDISMTDGIASWLAIPSAIYFESASVPEQGLVSLDGKRPGYNVYKTGDGKYISLGLREPKLFEKFCRAIGREELISYQNEPGEKREEMIAQLQQIFSTRTRDEWFKFLEQVDVSVAPVYSIDEVFSDPQIVQREMVLEMNHPTLEKVRQIGIPIKLSDTPGTVRSFAPTPGQHTEEVLSDLGYTQERIEELRREKAIQ